MRSFLIRRWFLVLLAIVLAVGVLGAEHLQPLVEIAAIRSAIVFTVLFLMAFPLTAGAIWNSLTRPTAPLLASGINYLVLPLMAWGLAPLLSAAGVSDNMVFGILVAAATPSTLASASVWTRRAGGNDAVSMMVTIITNALCFLITPMWLTMMIGFEPGRAKDLFDPVEMIQKLALLVVLPMVIAQLLRLSPPVGRFATRNKTPMGVLAQFGVLSMIFLGSIQTGVRIAAADGQSMVLVEIAVAIVVVVSLHVSTLLLGVGLARRLGINRADAIAVGISGSQKTLMVGLTVAIDLRYSVVPIVAYHVGQLLIDTVVADRYRHRTEELEQAEQQALSSSAVATEE
ncbi:MAG: bile acid:sodium symporter [Pirellulaceae bacterium]